MFDEEELLKKNGSSALVTVGDWVRYICLPLFNLIPIAGTVIYLIIVCKIIFSDKTARSLRNMLLAQIAISLVTAGLAVIICVFFPLTVGGILPTMQ